MFAEFEQYDPWARHWLRLLDDHGTSGTGAAGGSAADRSWTGTARTDRACRCQRRREQSYRARLGEAYEDALKDLLKKKQDGRPIERPERREPTNVVNLMEALRRRALRRAVSLLRAKKRHVPALHGVHPKRPNSPSGRRREEPAKFSKARLGLLEALGDPATREVWASSKASLQRPEVLTAGLSAWCWRLRRDRIGPRLRLILPGRNCPGTDAIGAAALRKIAMPIAGTERAARLSPRNA